MTPEEIQNERLKLTANWFNTLATAVLTAGLFVPAAQFLFGVLPANTDVGLVYGIGGILHSGRCRPTFCWSVDARRLGMSQTNQIIAMLFPLLAVVAAGLTAVVVRKPWRQKAVRNVQAAGIGATNVAGTGFLVAAKDLERRAHDLAQDL